MVTGSGVFLDSVPVDVISSFAESWLGAESELGEEHAVILSKSATRSRKAIPTLFLRTIF